MKYCSDIAKYQVQGLPVNRTAQGNFPLPIPANPHVSPEKPQGHRLPVGFTGFISTLNQRRFIMAVQCASFPMGVVVITPNALNQLTPADVQLGLQRHQAGDHLAE
ncbi:MAG: hypothetical protein WCJ07_03785 [Verrucomicrobiota bacterium]